MTGSDQELSPAEAPAPAESVLSPAEGLAAEALVSAAWGEPAQVSAAELIWNRRHVVRLGFGPGRSAVLKRRGDRDGGRGRSFAAELAALEYLNGMPEAVAPRLLGADADAGFLVMEDLGRGESLAGALLAADGARAQAALGGYARALGSLHAWSIRHPVDLAERAGEVRRAAGAEPATGVGSPAWTGAADRGRDEFLAAAATLDLDTAGADGEISQLGEMLAASPQGLVHGDACPDNTWLDGATCRIFDFEAAGWGPVVFDAAYLVAPFPSCWCFGQLPADTAGQAVAAYRDRMRVGGIDLGPDWDAATAAALGHWLVHRGAAFGDMLAEDPDWGTMTMRPRLLNWLETFTETARHAGVLPRLAALAEALHAELARRWPGTVVLGYPALARPDLPAFPVPGFWKPEI